MSTHTLFNQLLIYVNLYQIGVKKFFQNIRFFHAQLRQGFWYHANIKKTNDSIPRKHPDRQKGGEKDGQILFDRNNPATATDPTSTTGVDWQ